MEDAQVIDNKPVKRELPMLAQAGMVQMVNPDNIRKYAEQQKEIKRQVLRCTNKIDWVPMGDNMYLTRGGCNKIAALYGISTYFDEPIIEKIENEKQPGAYKVTVRVTCRMTHPALGTTIEREEYGSAESTDDFFAKRVKWEEKDGQKVKEEYYLPVSEINQSNVVKKAVTNASNRAIKSIAGIENVMLDDLKDLGFDVENMKAVNYDRGSKGGSKSDTWTQKDSDVANEVRQILWECAAHDNAAYEAILIRLTEFEIDGRKIPGKKSLKDLSAKQLKYLPKKAREEFQRTYGMTWEQHLQSGNGEKKDNGNATAGNQPAQPGT
jgi:hypothetical protein